MYVITADPVATPLTTPDVPSTVAIAVLLLVHEPEVGVADNVVAEVAQTVVVPEITGVTPNTVTVNVLLRPIALYVITAVPVATPVTIPDDEPTEATEALLLTHVPPEIG